MSTKESIAEKHVEGTIVVEVPRGLYQVRLDGGDLITAGVAPRVRGPVRFLPGERVRVMRSASDRSRGRIESKG